MENSEESNKKNKPKIYDDIRRFKGNTFEQNINTVNKLYLGLGLKISDVPYIYIDDTDNNIYLSAVNFVKENKDEKDNYEINYPPSFIYNVFYCDGLLFYFGEKNQLGVYKFDRNNFTIQYYETHPKYDKDKKDKDKKEEDKKEEGNRNEDNKNEVKKDTDNKNADNKNEDNKNKDKKNEDKKNKTIKKGNIKKDTNVFDPKIIPFEKEKDKVEKIIEKLEKIKNNNCKEDYEILCDVLANDLNIKLERLHPKEVKDPLTYEIDNNAFYPEKIVIKIKQIKYQIDSAGIIREKIKLRCGKIKLEDGIKEISYFATSQNKIIFDNSFKCPILFKNFEEQELPPDNAILCEIKSGFDVNELIRQLEERIKIIKKCNFNKGESPLYYIGIVNFYSENKDKLNQYKVSNFDKELKENIVIVAAVDFKYFGIDLSHEINDGYLLYKAIGNVNEGIGNLDKKVVNLDQRVGNLELGVGSVDKKVVNLDQRVGNLDKGVGNLGKKGVFYVL